jgi:Zn-finger nucleic acid-binding protein
MDFGQPSAQQPFNRLPHQPLTFCKGIPMKCPRCKTPDLLPTMIEEYLPAMGCGTCRGSLVSLLYYRHWAETHKPEPAPAPAATPPRDTTSAIVCPKCSRVMTKYRLLGSVDNRLDVCATCDEAWLDGGEWELLEQLQLSHKMPAIFTDAWQRRIRAEKTEETRSAILKKTIGEANAAQVEAFRAWLNGQKEKSAILTYLYRD